MSAVDFGTWLRREMTAHGYDVDSPRGGGRSSLATGTGLNISVVSRLLSNERSPEIDTLRKLGRAFGLSLGEMLVHAGLAEPDELQLPSPPEVARRSHLALAEAVRKAGSS